MRRRHLLPASLFACALAHGAEVSVEITDSRGRPVADTVVELAVAGGARAPAAAAPRTLVIDQKDERFIPDVEM